MFTKISLLALQFLSMITGNYFDGRMVCITAQMMEIGVFAPKTETLDSEVRSIFVSDLHLGSRFSRADRLLQFLNEHNPDYLYLVGDIVDGWILKRRWRWPECYSRLLDRLVELAKRGTIIRLTPGNHDEFLRRFLLNSELICIENQFIHRGADDRHFVVMHGDLFDDFESKARFLSIVGGIGYEIVLRIDHWVNRLLVCIGLRRRRISKAVKQHVKLAVQFVNGFETRVTEHAIEEGCDGVVCGHIHIPSLSQIGDVLYINLGDWIENHTALIEYGDGRLQLIEMDSEHALAESPSAQRKKSNKTTPECYGESIAGVA
jgi:UDP-2,3-diacylglucosamine pyrophosphatase LpxH